MCEIAIIKWSIEGGISEQVEYTWRSSVKFKQAAIWKISRDGEKAKGNQIKDSTTTKC